MDTVKGSVVDTASSKYKAKPMPKAVAKRSERTFTMSCTLKSTSVNWMCYREDGQVLVLMFHDGNVYVYADVPRNVALDLAASDSPGGYFQAAIRGVYEFTRGSPSGGATV